ncbi:competence protein ComK [Heyndrickxia acidiproducens]|uniref:competence protein ComK n=1 Tax=Heyndrickxia acidiproducens TaxID=1121084 RepID=UPI0004761584|nr:competence protein ComK [Heyndrickxia acidiproducens]
MKEIQNYLVNSGTYALAAARHPEYQTVIYDREGKFYSKQNKLDILDGACKRLRLCDYWGSARAVRDTFGYNKPPVIIGKPHIIATPTMSPLSFDCQFIFLANVLQHELTPDGLLIEFKNHQKLKLNCSEYTYIEQCKRTSNCALFFNGTFSYIPPRRNRKNGNNHS